MARASFLAARKHSGLDVQRLKEWASAADDEPDFRYALVGFAAALTHPKVDPLDACSVEETVAEFADLVGVELPKVEQLDMDYRSLVQIAQARLDALPRPGYRRFIEYVPQDHAGRNRLIPVGLINVFRAYGAGHVPAHLLDTLVNHRAARERRAIW